MVKNGYDMKSQKNREDRHLSGMKEVSVRNQRLGIYAPIFQTIHPFNGDLHLSGISSPIKGRTPDPVHKGCLCIIFSRTPQCSKTNHGNRFCDGQMMLTVETSILLFSTRNQQRNPSW